MFYKVALKTSKQVLMQCGCLSQPWKLQKMLNKKNDSLHESGDVTSLAIVWKQWLYKVVLVNSNYQRECHHSLFWFYQLFPL